MKLIAFCGKAGAGKTTAVKLLSLMVTKHVNIKMAQPIYDLANAFGWNGEKDNRGRKLLQEIGDVGRRYSEDWIVSTWLSVFLQLPPQDLVTCDDIRCLDEVQVIHNRGGKIVKVVGLAADLGSNATHRTEQGIADEECDFILHNDGTMGGLTKVLADMLGTIDV